MGGFVIVINSDVYVYVVSIICEWCVYIVCVCIVCVYIVCVCIVCVCVCVKYNRSRKINTHIELKVYAYTM